MSELTLFEKAKGHIKTVMTHKYKVMVHCVKAGIPIRGLLHDLSKFSPDEFFVSISHYQGNRSPNEAEREDYGYSKAWMHHKGRNKHHFEYWTDYNLETKKMAPVPMPFIYVVEMFCDRVAAGKTYLKDQYTDKSPLEYFNKGVQRRVIHPKTSKQLENMLKMLANEGEEATFARIRKSVSVYTKRQLDDILSLKFLKK